jgi:hypothetical protein
MVTFHKIPTGTDFHPWISEFMNGSQRKPYLGAVSVFHGRGLPEEALVALQFVRLVTYCLPVVVLHTSLTIPLVAVALPLLDLLPLPLQLQLLETRNMPDREDRRFRWEEKLCVLSNAPK